MKHYQRGADRRKAMWSIMPSIEKNIHPIDSKCKELQISGPLYNSLQILLSIATHENLKMVQFDVKLSLLCGELENEIFMKVPDGLKASITNTPKFVI
uniref:Uncharacterized protein n=1 Tax=Vespula pensylvanica TaxID=30213 RepID=A0A834JZ92_VESPE|nr:hypothetical protein H0235_016714 [Vespula pensylvanica]